MFIGEEKTPSPLCRSSTEEWWCRGEASKLLLGPYIYKHNTRHEASHSSLHG
jgi:hypothetical protein